MAATSVESKTPRSSFADNSPHLVVFSGGTAFNSIAKVLGEKLSTRVTYVLPVSDDGGSTAEIVRVLGGPAVGDIRSRCLRLSDASTTEAKAVRRLLAYRLDPKDATKAKMEWSDIVEGESPLWDDVSIPYRDTIRGFLVHFHTQVLRRSNAKFNFCNGSVGNFFFAGTRLFFHSLDAAIFLYSRVSGTPPESLVLPCIETNERLSIGAELQDGSIIRGQNQISHPNIPSNPLSTVVDKADSPPLLSPIRRIFYTASDDTIHEVARWPTSISSPDGEGLNANNGKAQRRRRFSLNFPSLESARTQRSSFHEVFPHAHPTVLAKLSESEAIVYGVGSLYTSIIPVLILRGVGEHVIMQECPKVLMLNGKNDRETSGMRASDFVLAMVSALSRIHSPNPLVLDRESVNHFQTLRGSTGTESWRAITRFQLPDGLRITDFVNCLLIPRNTRIEVDSDELEMLGITNIQVVDSFLGEDADCRFVPEALVAALGDVILNSRIA